MTPAETVLSAAWKAAAGRGDQAQAAALERALDACGEPPRLGVDVEAAAVWYANRRMRVLPVTPGEKRPLPGTRGVNDATCDPATIAGWFELYGRAAGRSLNLGVACGGPFDVLDVDGAAGADRLADRLGDGSWLDVRAVSETPRGVHLWAPAVAGAKNGKNESTGIDYRAAGGYAVVPPSHVGGTLYRWLLPPGGITDDPVRLSGAHGRA